MKQDVCKNQGNRCRKASGVCVPGFAPEKRMLTVIVLAVLFAHRKFLSDFPRHP